MFYVTESVRRKDARATFSQMEGRDWYDFEWYVKKGTSMRLKHFIERARGSDDLNNEDLTETQFRKLLKDRIDSVNIDKVKADVVRFIPDSSQVDIWSKKYFYD